MSLLAILSGCGSSSSGSGNPVVQVPADPVLSGLWIGTTNEEVTTGTTATENTDLPTFVFFKEDTVYYLRDDEARIGSYDFNDEQFISWQADIYSYANPDPDNLMYVGADSGNTMDNTAEIFDDTLVINYNNANDLSGTAIVTLDAQTDPISLSDVQGQWQSTDGLTFIDLNGNFSGAIVSPDCQWQGSLSETESSTDFPNGAATLTLNIWREECDDFNPAETSAAAGFAIIDSTDVLHFIAQTLGEVLWMRFTRVATVAAPQAPAP